MVYAPLRWHQREGKILECIGAAEAEGRLLSFDQLVSETGLPRNTAQLGLEALLDGSLVRGVDASDHAGFDYFDLRLLPLGRKRIGEWPGMASRGEGALSMDGSMDVFLSWSGHASHGVALALRERLPQILPQIKGWVSSEDIPKGTRWGRELDEKLGGTFFCIVCIVPGNVAEPWINFEAGAIAREVEQSRVTPLLVGLDTGALDRSPLSLFQAAVFEKRDMRRLVDSLNEASAEPLEDEEIAARFERMWPELEAAVEGIDLPATRFDNEATARPVSLEKGPESVLVALAIADHQVNAGALASHLNEQPIRVDYWIEELLGLGLVHDHLSRTRPVSYSLSASGKAYLVENDLV